MRQGWQEMLLRELLLLLLLLGAHRWSFVASQDSTEPEVQDNKILFGDKCTQTSDCGFNGSRCVLYNEEMGKCQCLEELSATNHIDKCGKPVRVHESCFFNEQCEIENPETECRDRICSCRFEKHPITQADGKVECSDNKLLFGDKCTHTSDCGFNGSRCVFYIGQMGKCQCQEELSATNHIDKCGKPARVNESCFFHEQCEIETPETECRDRICSCRFEKHPITQADGKVECIVVQNVYDDGRYIDPAMIGILVAMFLMFITICVVLRLFSKARWRENRTIFNTPNPRLMNVSLLRENKLLHQDRRGSKCSAKGPSRQPSMASLRAHSPNSQGSRRGSRGSSNASATSNRSNKSPPQAPNMNSVTTPMLASVTVEIQEPKA